jgi:hypothetical protein
MSKRKRQPTQESQLARVVRENPMFRSRCLDDSTNKSRYSRTRKHQGKGYDIGSFLRDLYHTFFSFNFSTHSSIFH